MRFSYGVLFGCGAGLAFPPGIFIVTSYFVKYRGFANGVAISGSCLGSMFLPPFLGYLIDNYGYKYIYTVIIVRAGKIDETRFNAVVELRANRHPVGHEKVTETRPETAKKKPNIRVAYF